MTKHRFLIPRLTAIGLGLTLTLTLAVAGCGDDPLGPNEGRVRFVLGADGGASTFADGGSAPTLLGTSEETAGGTPITLQDGDEWEGNGHGWFVTANVTFSSILARNQDGVLLDVSMNLPVTVDIMSMEGGKEIALPNGELPAGTYDQVVVVMTELQGVASDGTGIAISPPGGGWTAIVPVCPFDVVEGGTTEVGLTLQLRNAFSWREKRYHFKPSFTCEPDDSEG